MGAGVLKVLFSKRMFIILLMGFSSGLPLLATGSTLQAWMTDAKVDLTVIGIFSLVGLPYTFKFVWSPMVDRYVFPFLGRRRGWLLVFQLLLAGALALLGIARPAESMAFVALLAVLVTFFSASQDIVLDAYRREILPDEELGLGSSLFVNGYRIGMLASGALALVLADHLPWNMVYLIIAAWMIVGIGTTFFAPEPKVDAPPPKSLREAVVEPFLEYFRRHGAIEILAFVLLYKIGDVMASSMTTPFLLQIGFTKTEYAAIAKTFGLAAMLVGGFVGGLIMIRLGMKRSLWFFGILQALSTFGFSLQAQAGHDLTVLTGVVAFENLSSGLGTSVYVAFMASLCNRRFTATQYALLSSLIGIPRVIISAPTGWMAKEMGWSVFFAVCALAAIPGLLLLLRAPRWQNESVCNPSPLPPSS